MHGRDFFSLVPTVRITAKLSSSPSLVRVAIGLLNPWPRNEMDCFRDPGPFQGVFSRTGFEKACDKATNKVFGGNLLLEHLYVFVRATAIIMPRIVNLS